MINPIELEKPCRKLIDTAGAQLCFQRVSQWMGSSPSLDLSQDLITHPLSIGSKTLHVVDPLVFEPTLRTVMGNVSFTPYIHDFLSNILKMHSDFFGFKVAREIRNTCLKKL